MLEEPAQATVNVPARAPAVDTLSWKFSAAAGAASDATADEASGAGCGAGFGFGCRGLCR